MDRRERGPMKVLAEKSREAGAKPREAWHGSREWRLEEEGVWSVWKAACMRAEP